MSDDRSTTVLVLGGIRSGKSAFAEALVADAPSVRYVATAVGGEDDPEWRARIEEHQRRRPQSWTTEETGADPGRLTEVLTEAKPDETLLVDDLGGWVTALLDPARQPNDDLADVAALAAAVRACEARIVLVSPEVGLSLVPTTPVGRAFADALGTTNQALADAADRVALVVAGRPVWLKGATDSAAKSATATADKGSATGSATAEPSTGEPAADHRAHNFQETGPSAPAGADPATAEPDTAEQFAAEPVIVHPVTPESDVAHPATAAPIIVPTVTPGSDLPHPATEQPDAAQPLEAKPDSVEPATTQPGLDPTATAEPDVAGAIPAEAYVEPELAAPDLPAAAEESVQPSVLNEPTMALPLVNSRSAIEAGMDLPLPDPETGPDARDRLVTLDLPGSGLGALVEVIEFAASTQFTTTPRPWAGVRVLLITGSHAGGAAAGDDADDVERRIAQVENGEGLLSRLAGEAGADIAVLRTAPAGPIEDGPAIDDASVEAALRQGWQLADAAADAGRDLLVLASIGVGTDAIAAAVSAATTGTEPVAVLPRVLVPGGTYDDAAWMVRCAAVRDALHRIRQESRGAKDILRELGGADLAVATGALLGAAARRLPVLLDGPVGIAAGLVARDLASQTRHWCLLVDSGGLELVTQGADVLGLTPVVELGLGLGEGANALAALPLLRTAIGLAAAVPVHPALLADHDDDGLTDLTTAPEDDPAAPEDEDEDDPGTSEDEAQDDDFTEPAPHGPGPATTRE